MKSCVPTNLVITPQSGSIKLAWTMADQDSLEDRTFGNLNGDFYGDWSGQLMLVKRQHGFAKTPLDTEAVMLFNCNLDPNSSDLYFIDNGYSYDGSSATLAMPEVPGTAWPYVGKGLQPNIYYYYSLFSVDTEGNLIFIPAEMAGASYAFDNWGHGDWLWNSLPYHYQIYDNGDLKAIVDVIGLYFDGIKTYVDSMDKLQDFEQMHFDLLGLIEQELNWPSDEVLDPITRRETLQKIAGWLTQKGRLDAILDVVCYNSVQKITALNRWKHGAITNFGKGPIFKCKLVECDCSGYGYGYSCGYGIAGCATIITLPDFMGDLVFDDVGSIDRFFDNCIFYVPSLKLASKILRHEGSTRKLYLADEINGLTTDIFCKIIIGTPNSDNNTYQAYYNGKKCYARTPGIDKDGVHATLFSINQTSTLDEFSKVYERYKLMIETLMHDSADYSCYLKPNAYSEPAIYIQDGYGYGYGY